ncbi:MAG: hypothetical protein JWN79_3274 [Gemmatimonadetes bacterium]|jgi:hypothetical protein|nr:hypothetical protein [Gemmatimonadota bacterium]
MSFRARTPLLLAVVMALIGLLTLATRVRAQAPAHVHPAEPSDSLRAVAAGAVEAALARNAALHMEVTPVIKGDAADSAKAARIARELRAALAPFRDTAAAVAAGYRMFAPQLGTQRLYHFTNKWRAVQEGFRFDATRPTSLLYTRGVDGKLSLVGAMYTAPTRFGYDRLDARVPLSVARWHRHVNWCTPPRGKTARWLERRDGAPVFGPESPIATKAECTAAGGVFHAKLFGWMLHANVVTGTDAITIWGDDHAAHAMHDGMTMDAIHPMP